MKRFAWIVALAVTVLLAVTMTVFSLGEPPVSQAERSSDPVALHERTHAPARAPTSHDAAEVASAQPGPAAADSEHDAKARARSQLRERILAAQRARDGAAAKSKPVAGGGLTPRIAGHEALLAELNRDFMPLADECIEQALEREPELGGMLAIGLEIVADEDLGAVVEQVEFPARNEVEQVELQTCMRESLLSMLLPPPEHGDSGREQLLLTIPVEP